MWFQILFIAILAVFLWSYFQQQEKHKRAKSQDNNRPTPSPKRKKPFIRIEKVEDD